MQWKTKRRKHGCGCKTLTFMTGIWLLQAQKLLQMVGIFYNFRGRVADMKS